MTTDRRDAFLSVAAVVPAVIWYFVLARLLHHLPIASDFFHPTLLGQAFNSMAEYLLQGRFDVDPAAIEGEAFLVGDRTVAYFGIFCALLRLPFLAFPQLDIGWLSCLAATGLGLWFQLRALLLVRDSVPPSGKRDWLIVAVALCMVFGGQQVQFLRPSLYQEVVNWADALAMGFVFLAIKGLLRGFDTRTLIGMALFAGFALLARVSFGLGLYAALGGVLLLHWRRMFWPGLVLAMFIVATGIVNHGRWGSPFVFADFTKYALDQDVFPDRLVRLAAYGEFNPRRLGLGLSYYFVPIWTWVRTDGQLLFSEARERLIDAFELPAGSFLLSDPLLLGLAFALPSWSGLTRPSQAIWKGMVGSSPTRTVWALLIGLAIPPCLMLIAISMNYRYRVEFYPFLILAALLGVRRLCLSPAAPFRRAPLVAAVVLSIAVSHGMAAIYAVSPWGDADQYIRNDGWIGTYAPRLHAGHD